MIDRSKLPNTFEFVVTAGARARQLLNGSVARVEVGAHKKTTIAAREVLTGAVEMLPRTTPAPVEEPVAE
ncbi:MAG: DNA-directed RNA polymerase subunit omega [Vicinamibacterales bacterium]